VHLRTTHVRRGRNRRQMLFIINIYVPDPCQLVWPVNQVGWLVPQITNEGT
jgi:hypothetical protein